MFTFGTDPEIFVTNSRNHKLSAHGMLPGTKRNPHPLKSGGACQIDGTAVEFNTQPVETAEEFYDQVLKHMDEIKAMLDPKVQWDFVPIRKYSQAVWDKIPDNAKEIGCEPEHYVHKVFVNAPKDRCRGTGFHLHIGWTKGRDLEDKHHKWDCDTIATFVGRTLNEASVLWDSYGEERRFKTGYGVYHAHRRKPYGIELRTLSSRILKYPYLLKWLVDSVRDQLEDMREANDWEDIRTMYIPRPRKQWTRERLLQWYDSRPGTYPQLTKFPFEEHRENFLNEYMEA